jgi:RimJ/RimL family protein N-acetyltransferase
VISVRRTADLAAVAELDRFAFPSDEPVQLDGATWWIATDDGERVGFCGFAVYPETPRTVYLRRYGVVPAYRSAGIGSRMCDVGARHARKLGFRDLVTYTLVSNFPSMRALGRSGFVPHEPLWAYAGYADVMYWRRDLEAR